MGRYAYDWILFDLDETLFDFPGHEALLAMLTQVGLEPHATVLAEYKQTNHTLWERFNAGQIDAHHLQHERFVGIGQLTGHHPLELNRLYLEAIIALSRPLDGVMETLGRLRGRIGMGIITNGFSLPQRGRLQRHQLDTWFNPVLVSDEVGLSKPHGGIFELALSQLPVSEPRRVLMVGDNPLADIAGAAEAGLSTCWYDPGFSDTVCHPTHHIHHISQLLDVIGIDE